MPTQEQKTAYQAYYSAVRKGLIKRPTHCARCGALDPRGRDGRTLLQGHHADYSKPLDVEWICVKCHRKETRLPLGERNGNAKLRSGLVQAAILLHKEGFALSEIAEFYGVTRQAVSAAVVGKGWLAERAA